MAQQSKIRRKNRAASPQHSLTRFVLTGAGLGLYFGLFFRPVREPSLFMALSLGLIGALVMTLLTLRRPEARSPRVLLRYSVGAWLALTATLLVLEARHPVFDAAGKAGVALFTTAAGGVAGLWYAHRQRSLEERSPVGPAPKGRASGKQGR